MILILIYVNNCKYVDIITFRVHSDTFNDKNEMNHIVILKWQKSIKCRTFTGAYWNGIVHNRHGRIGLIYETYENCRIKMLEKLKRKKLLQFVYHIERMSISILSNLKCKESVIMTKK